MMGVRSFCARLPEEEMAAAADVSPAISLERFDLQLFGAEEEGRTEEPTEKKKREEREKGKVAKSMDLAGGVALFFAILAIYFYWGGNGNLITQLKALFSDFIKTGFAVATETRLTTADMLRLLQQALVRASVLLLPIFGVVFFASMLINALQVGVSFSFKPLKPDFSRIKPTPKQFIKKTLFSPQVAANLVKAVVKSTLIVVISFVIIRNHSGELSGLMFMTPLEGVVHLSQIAFLLIVSASLLLIVLGIPDYLFERWQHNQSLKMSKHEVKEERRQTEGDPLLRQRLRERQQEISQRQMMAEVPKADVVVTNPTHYAVALRYDPTSMAAPMVVAKGMDMIAQRIREIAQENDVVLYENKPLARALYAQVDIGGEIPEEFFDTVSRILVYVYNTRGQYAAG